MVGAIEAADAMCKAAHVRFTRVEVTRDAQVTVMVRGALADVEAAVAAGARAASRIGERVTQHVIPAPDPSMETVPLAVPVVADGRDADGM